VSVVTGRFPADSLNALGYGARGIGCGKLLESDEVATNYGAPHRDDGVR